MAGAAEATDRSARRGRRAVWRVCIGLAFAAALVFATGRASAADEWRWDAYNDLMSPYCPGRMLNDCPSPQAGRLREWIALQEDAGRSREDVEAELLEQYGDVMRSAPKPEGWGLVAYLIPIFAFAAGGGLVAFILRRAVRAGSPEPAAPPTAPDPSLERLLDEELRS